MAGYNSTAVSAQWGMVPGSPFWSMVAGNYAEHVDTTAGSAPDEHTGQNLALTADSLPWSPICHLGNEMPRETITNGPEHSVVFLVNFRNNLQRMLHSAEYAYARAVRNPTELEYSEMRAIQGNLLEKYGLLHWLDVNSCMCLDGQIGGPLRKVYLTDAQRERNLALRLADGSPADPLTYKQRAARCERDYLRLYQPRLPSPFYPAAESAPAATDSPVMSHIIVKPPKAAPILNLAKATTQATASPDMPKAMLKAMLEAPPRREPKSK